MLDIIDAINTIESVSTEFSPATGGLQIERGDEIASLWSAHQNAKIAARATKAELHEIRARLGEQLCRMKQGLAQPGRSGQWSSFLRERGIPRATADRLVSCHLRLLSPDANRPSEAVSEPTEEDVQRLFLSIWPRLRRSLRSRQSLQLFVDLLTSKFECGEATDGEILVIASPTATTCPASSDGDLVVEPAFCAATLVADVDEQVI
jgi:hypothetical protein